MRHVRIAVSASLMSASLLGEKDKLYAGDISADGLENDGGAK
jgi:hypothetical protein